MNPKLALAAATIAFCPLTTVAGTLEERVEALEHHHAELYHTLQERKSAGLMTKISERISLSGLLEVEAAYERLSVRGGDDDDSSELVLATAQLGLDAEVNDHVSANLILLYEEGVGAGVEVDEATVAYTRDPWTARIGRQYLPFGAYPSHFVSSPLTNELGETRGTAVQVGLGADRFSASAFLFSGVAKHHDASDHLDDWGLAVTATLAEDMEFGASLISDLAETGAELVEGMEYDDRVAGWSAYAIVAIGPLEVLGEVLGAVSPFAADDLDADGDGTGDQPFVWNLEVAADVAESVELAARIEGSSEFAGRPALQYGLCASWGPWENVSLSLEVLHGTFGRAFGDGADHLDRVTTQLAVEF